MVDLGLKEQRTNAYRKQKPILGEKVTNDKLIHSSPTFLAIQWHTLDPRACIQELLSAEVHKINMLSQAQTPAKEVCY